MTSSKLDLVMASTRDAIVMVEAGASEVDERVIVDALARGHAAIQSLIDIQERMRVVCGKQKRVFPLKTVPDDLSTAMAASATTRVHDALMKPTKQDRNEAIDSVESEMRTHFEDAGYQAEDVQAAFESLHKKTVRQMILRENVRPDGRSRSEIRPLSIEVGVLPRVHGSGLFSRGETQALAIVTLGSTDSAQKIDGLSGDTTKRYMLHYNFPSFSTGEARQARSPGRREIGHGMLAERALAAVIPNQEVFPYTIRIVSETLSSNGSTSMAATTAGTLALMDAGVPITAPVSGIAMGLITGDNGEYAILTDIQGVEDALGDMDFKVTGTRTGVTAIQMDIKISGLTSEILTQALSQAKEARLFILDSIDRVIQQPRAELSQYAPRITRIQISPEKIGTVIGPGGKMIKKIIEETKASIDIEDDGSVFVASSDSSAAQKAIELILALTAEVEVGKIYNGTVKRIMDFGAFIEVLPGKEGLCHISQLATHRVERVEDVVNMGDRLEVKVVGIDSMGRINLSHRAVIDPNFRIEGDGNRGGPPRRGPEDRGGDGFRRSPEGRGDRGSQSGRTEFRRDSRPEGRREPPRE
jgi:polyribonucleotide nucleotidyltransferase